MAEFCRVPYRQCRMARTETPQICAFSRSTTPSRDSSNANPTVVLGYMRFIVAVATDSQGRTEPSMSCAGSGIRTRTLFRADAFETSMSAIPSSRLKIALETERRPFQGSGRSQIYPLPVLSSA